MYIVLNYKLARYLKKEFIEEGTDELANKEINIKDSVSLQ